MTHHGINSIVAVSRNGWVTLGLVDTRTETYRAGSEQTTYDVWLPDKGVVTFTEEFVTEFDAVVYAAQHALFAPLYNRLSKELEKRYQKDASETENS